MFSELELGFAPAIKVARLLDYISCILGCFHGFLVPLGSGLLSCYITLRHLVSSWGSAVKPMNWRQNLFDETPIIQIDSVNRRTEVIVHVGDYGNLECVYLDTYGRENAPWK